MANVTVSNIGALNSALASATAGETIYVAPGTYSGLSVYNINPSAAVTITSLDPSNPAVLTNFQVNSSSNITFSHLELTTVGSTDKYYGFRVGGSSNITFNADYIHGAIGVNPNSAITGILITTSTSVSVTNSTFNYLNTGISEQNNSYVNLSGNSFSNLATDGIDNAGSSNVEILNNHFTDAWANTQGNHPDAIQFWTAGTTSSAQNITISGNTYVRGTGSPTQGIFMGNEINIPYENVTITNNTILGALYQGLTIGVATNVTVSGNTVQAYTDQPSWISVAETNGGSLTNNFATSWQINPDNTGVTQSGDVTIAAITPGGAPSLTNSGAAATYNAGGAAADIAHLLSLVDTNSPSLASATVSITGGFLAGDALNFANQAGITGSYNASTGVLTLSGTASQAAYQAALDSITFSSSATDPTHGGTDVSRAVNFIVNDGAQSSNPLAATVAVAFRTWWSQSGPAASAGLAATTSVTASPTVTAAPATGPLASAAAVATHGIVDLVGRTPGAVGSDAFILASTGHALAPAATLSSASVVNHSELSGLGGLVFGAKVAMDLPLADSSASMAADIGLHHTAFVLPLLGASHSVTYLPLPY